MEREFKMNSAIKHDKKKCLLGIWSMERIGRLITGVLTALFLIGGFLIHSLFFHLLLLMSFHSIYTTLTDSCPFEKLVRCMGGKQREELFRPNGETNQKLD